jgi:hypothetical protein
MLAGEHEKACQLYEKLVKRSATNGGLHKWKIQNPHLDADIKSK